MFGQVLIAPPCILYDNIFFFFCVLGFLSHTTPSSFPCYTIRLPIDFSRSGLVGTETYCFYFPRTRTRAMPKAKLKSPEPKAQEL